MDPSLLIPDPHAIPVAWGWFRFFLVTTFLGHLLLVNATLGTGLITLFLAVRRGPRDLSVIGETKSKLPYLMAFTINTGVAPLLFIQVLYGQFIYTSSVLMAVYWLSLVGLLLVAYYSAYIYDYKFEALGAACTFFMGLSVLALLLIGFLFANNLTLMLTPEKWPAYFDNPGGTLLNLREPTLLPRYLHFVAASVAVGGLVLSFLGTLKQANPLVPKPDIIKQGMRWFIYATLAQIPIGLWFLISLPREIGVLFTGGGTAPTLLFLLGLVGMVLSLAFGLKARFKPCAAFALLVIVSMGLMREWVRGAYLKPFFSPSSLKVVSQYSPLILFICVLLIGIGLVVYMLALARRSRAPDEGEP